MKSKVWFFFWLASLGFNTGVFIVSVSSNSPLALINLACMCVAAYFAAENWQEWRKPKSLIGAIHNEYQRALAGGADPAYGPRKASLSDIDTCAAHWDPNNGSLLPCGYRIRHDGHDHVNHEVWHAGPPQGKAQTETEIEADNAAFLKSFGVKA